MKLKTLAAVKSKVQELLHTILTSASKPALVQAFNELTCIVQGECICDICPEWDKNTLLLFELSRCFVTTHTLQLIKEKHVYKKRWAYLQPMYAKLFSVMFVDIDPTTAGVASIHDEHQAKCTFTLDPRTAATALSGIKSEQDARIRQLKKTGAKQKTESI